MDVHSQVIKMVCLLVTLQKFSGLRRSSLFLSHVIVTVDVLIGRAIILFNHSRILVDGCSAIFQSHLEHQLPHQPTVGGLSRPDLEVKQVTVTSIH